MVTSVFNHIKIFRLLKQKKNLPVTPGVKLVFTSANRLLATLRKNLQICMKFSGKVGNGPMNKWLNFGGNQDNGSGSILRH